MWNLVDIHDELIENVDFDTVRNRIKDMRWNDDFSPVTLYTTEDPYDEDVFDEVLCLSKYFKVFVVFNYKKYDEYKVEL